MMRRAASRSQPYRARGEPRATGADAYQRRGFQGRPVTQSACGPSAAPPATGHGEPAPGVQPRHGNVGARGAHLPPSRRRRARQVHPAGRLLRHPGRGAVAPNWRTWTPTPGPSPGAATRPRRASVPACRTSCRSSAAHGRSCKPGASPARLPLSLPSRSGEEVAADLCATRASLAARAIDLKTVGDTEAPNATRSARLWKRTAGTHPLSPVRRHVRVGSHATPGDGASIRGRFIILVPARVQNARP